MSVLIDRQAAIDTLADMHCKSDEDGYVWIIRSDAWARIDALPSAQPEIIRCKDCKHAKITADGKYMKYCSQWDVDDALYLDSGFFCGHAERRPDEQTD